MPIVSVETGYYIAMNWQVIPASGNEDFVNALHYEVANSQSNSSYTLAILTSSESTTTEQVHKPH